MTEFVFFFFSVYLNFLNLKEPDNKGVRINRKEEVIACSKLG